LQHHAEALEGQSWRRANWPDLAALALVVTIILLIGSGARQMLEPLATAQAPHISLSPTALPNYALRTTIRMLAALVVSLLFTFTYGTAAAKSRRAEMVLIPLLDVLQSVPVLGYLSFTVVFFVSLSPNRLFGAELAAIFAIFTSQAWNMAFSFFQALRTIPSDLDEASRGFRFSGWQRFWRVEVPFAMPGLIWNTMMSMSGGWFFVVASEAISVGNLQVALPGIGSYVARAIQERDLAAVGWAIVAMGVTIFIYDQLLFRPLVAWADKFRYEQTAAAIVPRSWIVDFFRRTSLLRTISGSIGATAHIVARARLSARPLDRLQRRLPTGLIDVVWYGLVAAAVVYLAFVLLRFARAELSWADLADAVGNGGITLLRVAVSHRPRDDHLGADRRCRRLAPGACGKSSADRPISRGIPCQPVFPAGGLSDRAVPALADNLVEPADDSGNAMVHPVQCHRWRQRFSDRPPGSGGNVPDTPLAVVARCHAAGNLPIFCDRRDHRIGRSVECQHRLGSG
jgi:NitT/TauT family transport system permease protein